jgi:hypothetical protein
MPYYEKHLPVRPSRDQKLVMNLLADRNEYLRTVRPLGGLAFMDNLAFTALDTRESYVVVQPRTEPSYLGLVGGLPALTRHLVLHEGAHQWIYRSRSPHCRWWPAWYAEGMAEYVAGIVPLPGGPHSDGFIRDDADQHVLDLMGGGRLLTVERLLHADPATFKGRRALYAQCWSFYRFLASEPGRLSVLHEEVRSLAEPPSPGAGQVDRRALKFARPCAQALVRACGPLSDLEKGWREFARRKTPAWFEPGRSSQRRGDEIVCAAFSQSNAMLMNAMPPGGTAFRLEGEFMLTGIGRREAKLYLGFERREDPRFVKLDMGLEGFFCAVSILPYADGYWQARYRNVAKFPADSFPLKTWVPFRVSADSRHVNVVVGDANRFRAVTPPGFDFARGCWGVGAYDGVVRFRKLSATGR